MKKHISRILVAITLIVSMLSSGCNGLALNNSSESSHTHEFTEKVISDKTFKEEATCKKAARYYYSCACGEIGETTFYGGDSLGHDYSAEVAKENYLKTAATCLSSAVYYKSCVRCGKKAYQTFTTDHLGDHAYTNEIPEGRFLKEEATQTSSAEFYKSCICGMMGTETFSYGEPLRDYTDEEKIPYMPTSLTVTLYDTETSTYGFTYNTQAKPLRPVIQIAKGNDFTDYVEYPAFLEEETSFVNETTPFTYYIAKAEVELEESETYTYRVYDKYVDVGTELATLQTKDLSSDEFTFAHVSDSQSDNGTGELFGNVLSQIVGTNDFILHTGDVVENSKLESEWTEMLDGNFEYLSQIPMMALSGNHETTYKNGSNETYKHFHNKITEQETEQGYYYSFVYGNAKFIMLNTNVLTNSQLTSDQYDWLVEELEDDTVTWKIVALHHPLYSPGAYGLDPTRNLIARKLQEQLQGIFAEYGVDVVLQGHDHVVSRTYPINAQGNPVTETWNEVDGVQYSVDPNGVIYVLNGPAGHQVRSPHDDVNSALYYYAHGANACSWADFSIKGNTMTVTVKYTNDGNVYEYATWGISKTA